ncbi:hypothetical protein Q3H58_005105 [Pseudomonas psychrotolerans]|nr:hypothetical protein [Pseudomonas psychrotolerans]
MGLAIHRHGAGQRRIGQAEVLAEQAAGGLHLVGDQAVDAQVAQRGRAFAAKQLGIARHVADHPEHRPGLAAGGAGQDWRQAAAGMAIGAYGLEVDTGRACPLADVRLVQQGDPVAQRDEGLTQDHVGRQVARQRRRDQGDMHGGVRSGVGHYGHWGAAASSSSAWRSWARSAEPVQKQAMRSCSITTRKCAITASLD